MLVSIKIIHALIGSYIRKHHKFFPVLKSVSPHSSHSQEGQALHYGSVYTYSTCKYTTVLGTGIAQHSDTGARKDFIKEIISKINLEG